MHLKASPARLFDSHGYVVLPGIIPSAFISRCRKTIQTAAPSDWIRGSNTPHRWRELEGENLIPHMQVYRLIDLEGIAGFRSVRQHQWINLFEAGQFVEAHKDAGGELHLLIPIEVPIRLEGGQFWLQQNKDIVPVGVGDALLFNANVIRHGTTSVKSGRRITFNARLWGDRRS